MYKCEFCGFSSESLDDFEEDFSTHNGFWCPDCDGFNQFNNKRPFKTGYRLFLETPLNQTIPLYVNLVLLKQMFPCFDIGGKSRLSGLVYENCRSEHMQNFIEPFAGGASVGLSFLLADKIDHLWLNDADFGVYSLFYMIKHMSDVLKGKIAAFKPSQEAYYKAQHEVLSNYRSSDINDAAWYALIVNRLAFSGIPYANAMSNPSARWNAKLYASGLMLSMKRLTTCILPAWMLAIIYRINIGCQIPRFLSILHIMKKGAHYITVIIMMSSTVH